MERVLLDGTFGLHLGGVGVAVVADIAGLGGSLTDPETALGAEPWAVSTAVVAPVVVVGVALALSELTGRRTAPVLVRAWGVAWIAGGGLDGRFEDIVLVRAAAVAAAVILVVPSVRRLLVARRDSPPDLWRSSHLGSAERVG